MTYRISTLLAATTMLVASAAHAAPVDWYAGLSGDLTWLDHSNLGGGGNVDIGTRLWPSNLGDFRIEAEAGYHSASGDNGYGGTHYVTYMGNLYYDFTSLFPTPMSGWKITPYVGGGIGDAEVSYGSSSFTTTLHHHENVFAYQGMTGLSFASAAMPNTDWILGYRYQGADDNYSPHLHSNNLELGLRFHF